MLRSGYGRVPRPRCSRYAQVIQLEQSIHVRELAREPLDEWIASLTETELTNSYLTQYLPFHQLPEFDVSALSALLSSFLKLVELDIPIPRLVFQFCWALAGDPEVPPANWQFVLAALRRHPPLRDLVLHHGLLDLPEFVASLALHDSTFSWQWDLLEVLVSSCRDSCDELLIHGVLDSMQRGLLEEAYDPDYWFSTFRMFALILEHSSPDANIIESLFTICCAVLDAQELTDLAPFCAIVECCEAVARLDRQALSENELASLRDKAFGDYLNLVDDDSSLMIIRFLTTLETRTPPVHLQNGEMLDELLRHVSADSRREVVIGLVQLHTSILVFVPALIKSLEDQSFVAFVLDILRDGSLSEKVVAARFFCLLTNRAFAEELAPLLDARVPDDFIALLTSDVSEADKLVLLTGILNVLASCQMDGRPMTDPGLASFLHPGFRELCWELESSLDAEGVGMVGAIRDLICAMVPAGDGEP
jgi:hypothetical protein